MVWLISATGVRVTSSDSVMSRPRVSATPIVLRRCGDAAIRVMLGSRPRSTGLPSTITSPPLPPEPNGMKFDAKALSTPGSDSTRRRMSSTLRAFASGLSYAVPGR